MGIMEIIEQRHSVRQYTDKIIESDKREVLDGLANELSEKSGLNIKIIYDDEKGFDSGLARYGKFKNVKNYIALFGKKGLNEAAGYYGEDLALKAQELGLNTCWVALTFNKKAVKKLKSGDEKLYCVIALGYGETQGVRHKSKSESVLTKIVGDAPEGFYDGVKAALLAPTAVNQQKFLIKCENGKVSVVKKGAGFYATLDLGIVKNHFEKASGIKVFG